MFTPHPVWSDVADHLRADPRTARWLHLAVPHSQPTPAGCLTCEELGLRVAAARSTLSTSPHAERSHVLAGIAAGTAIRAGMPTWWITQNDLEEVEAHAIPDQLTGKGLFLPRHALIVAWPSETLKSPTGSRCAYAILARVHQKDGTTAVILTTTLDAPRPADLGGGDGPADTMTAWVTDADQVDSWWEGADPFQRRITRRAVQAVLEAGCRGIPASTGHGGSRPGALPTPERH